MAQVDFACRVLGFIKRLLRAVLPALARDKGILGTKEQFQRQLDAAFTMLDPHEATEHDYRLAVANAACLEVSKLCELLTEACCCVGFEDAAKRYLAPKRFVLMLLKRDTAKLDALTDAVKSADGNVGRLLMRIGAVLEGRPDTYDEMDASAKRKATIDTKKIIAEVKTIAKKLDSGKAEIVEHIDAVGKKVEKLKLTRKRKSKYSDEMRTACLSYWEAAQTNETVRSSINTRPTYETAFRYFARQLAKHGIDSVKKFKAVLRSMQSTECTERHKKLDEQRDGTKKKPLPPPKENGKMSGDGKGREKGRRR